MSRTYLDKIQYRLRDIWEKNWPEIHSAVRGSLPDFILSKTAKDLGKNIPVFCYHEISSKDFEKDIVYLKYNGYHTLKSDQLLDYLEGRFLIKKPSVVLTFDDSPLNFYKVTFPLLEKYGCNAVAFVSPYFIDLAESNKYNEQRTCTWQELLTMHRSGLVDIQSHTFEHRYLPRWPESAPLCGAGVENAASSFSRSIEDDFRLAKISIEQRLGKKIQHLAFPRYMGTKEAIRIGKKLGYKGFWWGLLPEKGINRPGDTPERIARISGEFLRRLPGNGRIQLSNVLRARYARVFRSWFESN